MIEELKLVQTIVSGSSSAGIWGFLAYLFVGLAKSLVAWGGMLVGLKLTVAAIVKLLGCPMSRDEQVKLQAAHDTLATYSRITEGKLRAEIDEVKSLHKTLKNAWNAEKAELWLQLEGMKDGLDEDEDEQPENVKYRPHTRSTDDEKVGGSE